LRARIELFENSNGEEDPKFSTPTGEVKEAETPKEAVRPPREGLGSNRSSLETETPKEAVRPPKGSLKPQDSNEAETTKEAVCIESCKNCKDAETTKEAARPPKSAVQDPKERLEAEGCKEAERPPESTSSTSDDQKAMMAIMLKLMEGMQGTHKRLMDGRNDMRERESEYVRSATQALPPLAEWNAMTGPIDVGDWLALIEPMMSDLASTSSEWWQTLMSEAYAWYQRHLQLWFNYIQLQHLDKISHTPTPSSDLARAKWNRLEKRTLLHMAVPASQGEDLISSKRLTALGIVCQLLVIYQPGGLAEKELVLRSLEQPAETPNLPEAVQSLRKWMRWRRRASDFKICEPDPVMLLKGLNCIIRKPLESHRDPSHPLLRACLRSLTRWSIRSQLRPSRRSLKLRRRKDAR